MSMAEGAIKALNIVRGDCLPFLIEWAADGAPVDLTGYGAELAITWDNVGGLPGVTPGAARLDPAAIDAPNGAIDFLVPAAITAEWGPYHHVHYQIRVTQPDGCVKTILRGPIKVHRAVAEEVPA